MEGGCEEEMAERQTLCEGSVELAPAAAISTSIKGMSMSNRYNSDTLHCYNRKKYFTTSQTFMHSRSMRYRGGGGPGGSATMEGRGGG